MQQANQLQVDQGRRRLLRWSGLLCAACALGDGHALAATPIAERVVDAGPLADYASEGVHDRFVGLGFFVIRRQGKLLALSAVCTHKKCKLAAAKDRSFFCDCHGSTFDADGRVTEGPAKRNLPFLATQVNDNGHLLVHVAH